MAAMYEDLGFCPRRALISHPNYPSEKEGTSYGDAQGLREYTKLGWRYSSWQSVVCKIVGKTSMLGVQLAEEMQQIIPNGEIKIELLCPDCNGKTREMQVSCQKVAILREEMYVLEIALSNDKVIIRIAK